MSKSVALESNEGHESREMSGKRGAEEEGDENEEGIPEASSAANSTTLITVSTAPAATDQRERPWQTRSLTREWREAGGEDHSWPDFPDDEEEQEEWLSALEERRKLVTRVIFLLNVTKVGERACCFANNLVIVEIPEGVKSIGKRAFNLCRSLITVSFPTTLTSIVYGAFAGCFSLETVDLLHTNLKELGYSIFSNCYELKSMTIPDSLQTLGDYIFFNCSKLVPSNINTRDIDAVVTHLRSKQQS
ncbi:hypothetical protein TrLO_g11663 [Triparma laevis f. longispina]|uniref:Uncharacterized protein n=1 Tax=Triparma laevis f. longispina TaxID=1714387 RepID=A0A9W7C9H8_9STRA|nr:hypothetical protein TrLO_g11663 [Triparma laevis f. longispina]